MTTKRRPGAAQARAAWEQLAERKAIVTAADLQARWGLTQQRVQKLVAPTAGFAEPISGGYGAIWLAADVDEWTQANKTRPGKPGPRSAMPELGVADADADREAWQAIKRSGGLTTIAELAAEWGITERAARNRTKRDGFPEPVTAGRWLNAEIQAAAALPER
ncbi:MAG: hypothetical protein REI11_08210 [Patulibacter sp.]|nr:hypothetical protein [Patulibacter sp.]